jgi:hypothetical protein
MAILAAIVSFGSAILTVLLFTSADEIGTTHPEGHRAREAQLESRRGTFGAIAAVIALVAWFVVALSVGAFHTPGAALWMTVSGVLTAAIGVWLGYSRPVLRTPEYR